MNYDHVWRKLSTQPVLRTPYYGVRLDRLRRPAGDEVDYYVLEFARQAVGTVAVRDDGRLLLVRQWRHPVEKLTWSIPAGGMEVGESAADAALRELREETGYDSRKIEPLYHYHPTIGIADQTFHLFIAADLEQLDHPDAGEIHEVEAFSRAQIETMLAGNEVVDGMSLTGLLLWLRKAPL